MTLAHRARRTCAILATFAFVAIASHASAQEISDSHLKAARAAIASINVTDAYDMILPQAAQALKQELIQQHPNLQELIITTVDEKTLALAGRRLDLEREAALAYARLFSEDELNAISAFYTTAAGKKLLDSGPLAAREVAKAADIWQRGIARDLAQEVGTHLVDVVNAQAKAAAPAPAADGTAPAAPEGEAPAPDGTEAPAN